MDGQNADTIAPPFRLLRISTSIPSCWAWDVSVPARWPFAFPHAMSPFVSEKLPSALPPSLRPKAAKASPTSSFPFFFFPSLGFIAASSICSASCPAVLPFCFGTAVLGTPPFWPPVLSSSGSNCWSSSSSRRRAEKALAASLSFTLLPPFFLLLFFAAWLASSLSSFSAPKSAPCI